MVHSLSKLCQMGIEHLATEKDLPRMDKCTQSVILRINSINVNKAPLPSSVVLAFADICKMYPSVDLNDAIESVRQHLQ